MVREEYHSRPVSALIRDWLLYNKAGGGGGILKTVTGNPISISDALAAPIQSLSVSLSPIQEGSGDPSPVNIRPITGRDSVTVERTGKNLFNKTTVTPTRFVSADGTLAYSTNYAASDYIPVKAGVSMIVSGLTASSAAIKTAFYDREKVFISAVSQNKPTYSFTTPSGAEYARITVPNADIDTAQLEIGSTPSAYAPYDGASVTIQLGQTVYSGTVDVTGGKIRIDRKLKIVNSVSLVQNIYIKSDAMDGYVIDNDIYPRLNYYDQLDDLCADSLAFQRKSIWVNAGYANCWTVNQNQIHINIANDLLGITDYTQETVASAKNKLNAYLAAHPVTLTIPIEPFDIDITPASLSTLRGDNTVWSDGDEITMTYKAASE